MGDFLLLGELMMVVLDLKRDSEQPGIGRDLECVRTRIVGEAAGKVGGFSGRDRSYIHKDWPSYTANQRRPRLLAVPGYEGRGGGGVTIPRFVVGRLPGTGRRLRGEAGNEPARPNAERFQ
jgi:hypothetical protein